MSIRKKVLSVIFLAVFLMVLMITLFTTWQIYNIREDNLNLDRLKENNQSLLEGISKFAAEDFDEQLSEMENHTNIVKLNLERMYYRDIFLFEKSVEKDFFVLSDGVDYDDIKKELKKVAGIKELMSDFENIDKSCVFKYTAVSGFTVYSSESSIEKYPDKLDLRNTSWYKRAIESSKDEVWSEIYKNDKTNEQILTCAISVRDQEGNIKGVVSVDIDTNEFFSDISWKSADLIDYVFISKNDGTILSGSNNKYLTDYVDQSEIKKINEYIVNKNFSNSVSISNKYVFTGQSSNNAEIFVGVLISNDKIEETVKDMGRSVIDVGEAIRNNIKIVIVISIIIMIVSISMSIFVSSVVNRAVIIPINELSDGAKKIGDGDLDYIINVPTNDELKDLSDSFNDMTKRLKIYINDLSLATAYKERIDTELKVARTIQLSMLPNKTFNDDNFDIIARSYPAKEVGGDFYDYFFIDEDNIAIIIADVSGKGIPAALFMVKAKLILKDNILNTKDPAKSLYNTNNRLYDDNEADMFVTSFIAILNIKTGELTYSNAGHNHPLIYSLDIKGYDYISPKSNSVLAAFRNRIYVNEKLSLKSGERLFCYTDGVTEAMDNKNKMYNKQRLKNTLNSDIIKNSSIKETVELIKKDIENFANNRSQRDDITIVVLEKK